LTAVLRAWKGYRQRSVFSKTDNSVRHWTATIAHVQLMIGILLYSQSPIISYFWKNTREAIHFADSRFFAIIHMLAMLIAIVIVTIGSAVAKRKTADHEKFRTLLIWFGLALLIIFMAIPWPFSPLAQRPYLR
ncbi:MAG: hypothetical protein EOP49_30315, partial [Sphingobacteriales bacterium]